MGEHGQPSRRTQSKSRRPLDVAIIGMACRFPGARDLFQFWKNVLSGRDCTRDVPADRWDASVFFDPESLSNDRVACKRGGYLDAPIDFDPTRYGVMPLAVEGGEPEQFLVLDTARAALDDAALPGGVPQGSRVEVVIGRGNYFNRGNLTRLQHGRIVSQTLKLLRALHPEWSDADIEAVRTDLKASLPPFEAGTIPGQVTNATAGRVADRLNLNGASYVVDAASASALVAVDLGARALVERRADLALVGSVYLQSDVDFPLVFARLGALSRSGVARPFAASADGTIPGEGVGVVVLKRLADAERDGNRVYAVIKGVGLASDGRGSGLAAPSARGHARAMRRAYRIAGIDPATVDLVEGHGLGVPASDRAELRALNAVFPMSERRRRTLGAVSAQIGHAMPAAGMAGLIKTALALHHRLLPATVNVDEPHSLLREDVSPFSLNSTLRPWINGDSSRPRRAGINAFGFAGINAHAVLEEHTASADGETPGCMPEWDSEAILLGAGDRQSLINIVNALIAWLQSGENSLVPLKDLAYTLNTGQANFPFRVGLVVETTLELRDRLVSLAGRLGDANCRSIRDARGTYFWVSPLAGEGSLAFLFPGEGSQYPGMLADLCPHFPELRRVLDTSDRIAWDRSEDGLPTDQIFGLNESPSEGLWNLETAVNLVLSSQWALYQLLKKLDLKAEAVVGHSSGEFLALAAAGVFQPDRELEDRLGDLGAVFGSMEKSGKLPSAALVAVAADRTKVEAVMQDVGGSVEIAIDNCPHQVVIAGDRDAVDAVATRLREQGVLLEQLPFERAYHTQRFDPALSPIREFFHELTLEKPTLPIYSCASASRMDGDIETIRRLAVDQWVSRVSFRTTIETMHADGVRLFVEVGARGNLTGFVEDTLRGRPHFAVAANVARRSGVTQLNHLVASLYAQGVSLRPDYLYARRRPCQVDLSTDYLPPRTGQPLEVGFPELTLSDALLERLRHKIDVKKMNGSTLHLDGNGHVPSASNGHSAKPHTNGFSLTTKPTNGHRESAVRGEHYSAPRGLSTSRLDPALFDMHTNGLGSISGNSSDEPLLAYFKTMDDFLETQRQVMETYLKRRPASEPMHEAIDEERTLESVEFEPKTDHFASSLPETEKIEPVALDPEPSLDVKELLLTQVSRRTGYPREMLDLDYDMEGDLGIDSIKRVEILGELQTLGAVPGGTDLEKLSRCRTLGQIVALLGSVTPHQKIEAIQWVGDIEKHVPGREFIAVRWLDPIGDPVAANHTLGGRRVSAIHPERLGLPVVPFTVMAELLAQGAAVLMPDRVVVELRDVQANRWLPYSDVEPVALEIRAERDATRPEQVRVTIRNRGVRGDRKISSDEPTVTGVIVFADRREPGYEPAPFRLDEGRASRYSASELYDDQWLFHGPALRALTRVGQLSRSGIEGTIRVLPRRDLLPEPLWPDLHTDPIVLDAFTHLLGCWGIDELSGDEGSVIFPLRLGSLTIFGADPPEGSAIDCRIRMTEVSRHRVRVDAELVGPDGRVWFAFKDWEDWRFFWPDRYRDVCRAPDVVFVGEPIALTQSGVEGVETLSAVWLEPPADFGKPVWRDVLHWLQSSPRELAADRARAEDERESMKRTLERTAAKEAARRLWLGQGARPVYPADLEVETGEDDRVRVRSLLEPSMDDLPIVVVASANGVAVAIASLDPHAKIGVAIERVLGDDDSQARDLCARLAAERAGDPRSARVEIHRRGEFVWAWAIVGGAE